MRWKRLFIVAIFVVFESVVVSSAAAQEKLPVFERASEVVVPIEDGQVQLSASESAVATPSGLVAKITEKGPDLTETQGEAKGKLGKLLLAQQLGPVTPVNFLRQAIRRAVEKDVPANTIVLMLLFPLVTAIIAASRHLIGLKGFGIFTPAVVSVGFLATGIVNGLMLFTLILLVATVGRVLIRRLKLPYMPRTALLLWLVSLAVLGLILAAPYFNLSVLVELSIFPILLLVLLAETFIDVQNKRGMGQAVEMTAETLILATLSYFVMKLEVVQTFVLLNPELVVVAVALFNVFLGRFEGLRLMEHWRFRKILS